MHSSSKSCNRSTSSAFRNSSSTSRHYKYCYWNTTSVVNYIPSMYQLNQANKGIGALLEFFYFFIYSTLYNKYTHRHSLTRHNKTSTTRRRPTQHELTESTVKELVLVLTLLTDVLEDDVQVAEYYKRWREEGPRLVLDHHDVTLELPYQI